MKKRKYTPEPLVLEGGYFSKTPYTTYNLLNENATNWQLNCTYQLKRSALSGQLRILHLDAIQLAYDQNSGGLMNDSYSALDTISVALIDECVDKAFFHRTKLQVGDIIFFDNSQPYNFMTNDYHSYVVLTIHIDILGTLQPIILQALNHTIKDTNGDFSTLVHQVWHRFTNNSALERETKDYQDAEAEIISALRVLLETQTPTTTKLTKGEEIALAIRDQVYAHMDGSVNIASLAKQYNISERSLQNSFKSLFGFTPTYFIRQMKLNLAYRDLRDASLGQETVSIIAQRWGFMHMGYFSKVYTKLFNENPSQTLKTSYFPEETIAEECVERQEEIID